MKKELFLKKELRMAEEYQLCREEYEVRKHTCDNYKSVSATIKVNGEEQSTIVFDEEGRMVSRTFPNRKATMKYEIDGYKEICYQQSSSNLGFISDMKTILDKKNLFVTKMIKETLDPDKPNKVYVISLYSKVDKDFNIINTHINIKCEGLKKPVKDVDIYSYNTLVNGHIVSRSEYKNGTVTQINIEYEDINQDIPVVSSYTKILNGKMQYSYIFPEYVDLKQWMINPTGNLDVIQTKTTPDIEAELMKDVPVDLPHMDCKVIHSIVDADGNEVIPSLLLPDAYGLNKMVSDVIVRKDKLSNETLKFPTSKETIENIDLFDIEVDDRGRLTKYKLNDNLEVIIETKDI